MGTQLKRIELEQATINGHLKLKAFPLERRLFHHYFYELSSHFSFSFHPQNLKDQILTTNIWLEHEWQDHKFKWEPAEYGGVTELYVPSEHIWLPDIVLYNK